MTEMAHSRGTKEAQAARRAAGLRMLSRGRYKQQEIAEALGVAHGTVRGWSSSLKAKGKKAFLRCGQRGRPKGSGKALTKKEEDKVIGWIRDKNPQQMKLDFYLWSVGSVLTLVDKSFQKVLSESCIRKYLKSWGFTVQRPATRYSARDDQVVEAWLAEVYPKISKQSKDEGSEIHWLDETGVNNQAIYMRGYSPKGKTPLTQKPSRRAKVNLVSTVTNRGTIRFSIYEGSLKSLTLIRFLENLVKGSQRKILVIMDNLPVHKSKHVQEWLAPRKDQIEVFYLPPYAPELNPDEYLNNALKQNVHKRSGLPLTFKKLKSNVSATLRHIQKKPEKVQSFFKTKYTAYAA